MFYQYADAARVQMAPGLIRRTLISGETLMICRFDLDQGVEIPSHSHPHDQAGYVVSGLIRVTVDGEGLELGPGDSYCAPSGVLHSCAGSGEDCGSGYLQPAKRRLPLRIARSWKKDSK